MGGTTSRAAAHLRLDHIDRRRPTGSTIPRFRLRWEAGIDNRGLYVKQLTLLALPDAAPVGFVEPKRRGEQFLENQQMH